MYISKYIKIDQNIPLKKWHLGKIKHNKKTKDLFLLCTPVNKDSLFEIIHGSEVNKKYAESYVLGISKSKQWLIDEVASLVDQLYNTKTLDYDMLKVQ